MRDYLRRQNKEAITGVPEVVSAVTLEEPSRYKGRFKLNTWTHKSQKKSLDARKAKSRDVEEEDEMTSQELELGRQGWQSSSALHLPNPVFSVSGRLDPFNSLAIQLGPPSEDVFNHCQLPTVSLRTRPLSPNNQQNPLPLLLFD
jgi:hypothetical protein